MLGRALSNFCTKARRTNILAHQHKNKKLSHPLKSLKQAQIAVPAFTRSKHEDFKRGGKPVKNKKFYDEFAYNKYGEPEEEGNSSGLKDNKEHAKPYQHKGADDIQETISLVEALTGKKENDPLEPLDPATILKDFARNEEIDSVPQEADWEDPDPRSTMEIQDYIKTDDERAPEGIEAFKAARDEIRMAEGQNFSPGPNDAFGPHPHPTTRDDWRKYADEKLEWIPRGRAQPNYRKRELTSGLPRRVNRLIKYEDYYTLFSEKEKTWRRQVDQCRGKDVPGHIVPARNGMTPAKFLTAIGRGCEAHIDLFEDWNHFASCKTRDLKALGIGVIDRKWILKWIEKYKQGQDPYLIKLKSKSPRSLQLEWRQKEMAARRGEDVSDW